MNGTDRSEQFVQQLTESQGRLYGYVYSLLGDHSRAGDVLQETNLVLWRKVDEFHSDKPFLPWAMAIARFQVLAHLRDHRRDKLLLDADLAEALSEEVSQTIEQTDVVRDSLRPCLEQLAPKSRELVSLRYFRGKSIAEVAEVTEKTISSIKVALMRVRRQLADCVQRRAAEV